jgi:hypothetical protein
VSRQKSTIDTKKDRRAKQSANGQVVVTSTPIISQTNLKIKIGEEKMLKKGLSDARVEEEILKLQNSEFVKLARKEERNRYQRRQYLYTLRQYEKKGIELAKAGITMEMLEKMAKENAKDNEQENI